MKRKTILSTALVICLSVSMMTATACKSADKETTKAEKETTEAVTDTSEETEATTTAAEETSAKESTSEATTEASEEKKETSDVKAEPSTEQEASTAAESSSDDLYAKAEKYINAAFAFYEKDAGQKLNLVVFESQIEETADGFAFDVRSRDGEQANVLVAKVYANTTTGEMSDEWGRTWNVSDFS
jgi:hypothetical protein